MRVVVLGGAGNFGARIVRALQGDPTIDLVSAGRRATLVAGAESVPVVSLDVNSTGFGAQLRQLNPGLVIHCVGPFQGQDYSVAEASLAAGAHYLDLADGRDFVVGFAATMQTLAMTRGRVAISGASTLPALSSAVIEHLRLPLSSLEEVAIAIAPGQRAPRGAATLAAVLSYLGRPFPVWHRRTWQTAWGWMGLRRIRFAFGTRWGAACDVPDLALLPARYPQLHGVSFHAALEIRIQQLALWTLAAMRRLGLPLPIERWTDLLNRWASAFDGLGGKWGGMRVSVAGTNVEGVRVRRIWQLTAPALNGPQIPCLAAILLARRLARGELHQPGAAACTGFLVLSDFEPEFAKWGITTRIEEVHA